MSDRPLALVPRVLSISELIENIAQRVADGDMSLLYTLALDNLSGFGSIDYSGYYTAFQWVNTYYAIIIIFLAQYRPEGGFKGI